MNTLKEIILIVGCISGSNTFDHVVKMNIESATQVLTSLQSTPDQVQNVISCLIDLLIK